MIGHFNPGKYFRIIHDRKIDNDSENRNKIRSIHMYSTNQYNKKAPLYPIFKQINRLTSGMLIACLNFNN
jgi:hypothetical protein